MRYLLPLLFITLTASCSEPAPPAAEPSEATTNTPATFVANPQPVPEQAVPTLPIGSPAPDFRLVDVEGNYRTLADYADAEVLVLIFTANHCPTAQAYEERMKDFAADYAEKGVQLVAISPNSPLGLLYNELGYSDLNDDYVDMKIRARDHDFNFPYLYDGDDHAASLKYGPVATPHAFVFDAERHLAYAGRLDATERPGTANAEDLRAAVDALLAGEKPPVATTKTFGCSTKWAWKTEYKGKDQAAWEAKPVTLESIDAAGVKELLRNEDSGKLRLLNVWATWCGPCVQEYPDFLVVHRMYADSRDFEFVSLSADKPDRGEKALEMLKKFHSPVANYHFSEDDSYALIEAVDPEWNGALPYTILVEPGGKVVWSHQGTVDFLELKRAIVEHPSMGRYF